MAVNYLFLSPVHSTTLMVAMNSLLLHVQLDLNIIYMHIYFTVDIFAMIYLGT